ncbi:MAG: ABC transporter ATP-binding protein [Anaerolineales bacterium]
MQLELRHITKTFGPLKANNDINYTFEGGKTYAILGENGAGKSTLMKIIAGYQPPDAGGTLLLDGIPITIQSPNDAIQSGIGMLYQDPLDFPSMTILENYITLRPDSGWLPDWGRHRADLLALCKRFGFELNPDALIESLTIGERQQLEIVRLLSLGVRILILDEPTTGISEEQRVRLFATLRQLATQDGLMIAIVTHKLEDVHALCDEILVLRYGRVTGTPSTPIASAELVRLMFGQPPAPIQLERATLGEPILQVRGITVQTRYISIENISLDVHAGEVIGLAGLDGSGQVAFMRHCAGIGRVSWGDHVMSGLVFVLLAIIFERLLGVSETVFVTALLVVAAVTLLPLLNAVFHNMHADANSMRFRGQSTVWKAYRDLRQRGLAYLSAGRLEEGLVSGLTLTQHMALIMRGRAPWINWFAARHNMRAAIQTYDIRGGPTSPIQTLSGGNQQRVALALLPDNLQLVFLENPTRGLDVNSAQNIWGLLLRRREQGTAIIFSSPDLDEIVQYSDRVMVFSSGKYKLVEAQADINPNTLGLLIGGQGL